MNSGPDGERGARHRQAVRPDVGVPFYGVAKIRNLLDRRGAEQELADHRSDRKAAHPLHGGEIRVVGVGPYSTDRVAAEVVIETDRVGLPRGLARLIRTKRQWRLGTLSSQPVDTFATIVAEVLPWHVVPPADFVVLEIKIVADALTVNVSFQDVVEDRVGVCLPVLGVIDGQNVLNRLFDKRLERRIVLAELEGPFRLKHLGRRKLAKIGETSDVVCYRRLRSAKGAIVSRAYQAGQSDDDRRSDHHRDRDRSPAGGQRLVHFLPFPCPDGGLYADYRSARLTL